MNCRLCNKPLPEPRQEFCDVCVMEEARRVVQEQADKIVAQYKRLHERLVPKVKTVHMFGSAIRVFQLPEGALPPDVFGLFVPPIEPGMSLADALSDPEFRKGIVVLRDARDGESEHIARHNAYCPSDPGPC